MESNAHVVAATTVTKGTGLSADPVAESKLGTGTLGTLRRRGPAATGLQGLERKLDTLKKRRPRARTLEVHIPYHQLMRDAENYVIAGADPEGP